MRQRVRAGHPTGPLSLSPRAATTSAPPRACAAPRKVAHPLEQRVAVRAAGERARWPRCFPEAHATIHRDRGLATGVGVRFHLDERAIGVLRFGAVAAPNGGAPQDPWAR